jgi:hypothetical protein
MRNLSRLLLAAALALGVSGGAGAAELTLTGGVLGISIGALPPITFGCKNNTVPTDPVCPTPIVLTVTNPGAGGGFTEPADVFTGSVMLPTSLFTGVALIDGLTIGNFANSQKTIGTDGAAGPRTTSVIRAGGNLGGPGALAGGAFVNVLGLFNLAVPLNVIGNTNASTAVVAGSLSVTVAGTGWTTGAITISNITTEPVPEQVENTVTNAGYDNRNGNGTGIVQLISAFHVTTNAAGNLPGLATQTLTFSAPEPGQILLVGAALGTLALIARRRTRR